MTLSPHTSLDALGERLAAIPQLKLTEHEPMGAHVSMGVGGPARWFAVAESLDALRAALALLRESGLPWMMLGGGSNTFFGDRGYAGVVVALGRAFREIVPGPAEHQLTAGAAATLSALMNAARRAGLTGLEFTAGIPGTLGGALWGNAGTAAGEVCPLAESVECLEPDGSLLTLPRGAFQFGYRWSELCERVIVRATLQLAPGDPAAIQEKMQAALAKRGEQPIGQRCSGCMFKNPPGDYAGRLIDRAGLKGLRVGGASVSQEHANFMVNDGAATARDLQDLVELVRRRVHESSGIELETEVRMVELDSPPDIH